jgi:hypothetical protein
MRSPKTLRVYGDLKQGPVCVKDRSLCGWTVDNFQLSETVLRGRGGEPEGRAAAQVACEPTAGVSVRGCLCVCVYARTPQLRVCPACISRTRTCPEILVRTGRARSSSC